MEFRTRLYEGELVSGKIDAIKEKLCKHEVVPFVHVITLPLFEDGILEIYPEAVLVQKYYWQKPVFVAGIAGNKREAKELVHQMIQDCYQSLGNLDIRTFLNP